MILMILSLIVELFIPGLALGKNMQTKPIQIPQPMEISKPQIASLPVKVGTQNRTILSFSGMVIDQDSNTPILTKGIDEKRPIASITKLMTAMVIIKNHDLNEIVTVPDLNIAKEETKMGLKKGEKLTVLELLHGLLIPSGADAAVALAVHHSGSVPKFVDEMNAQAKEWNLTNTLFQNPIGSDAGGGYSTARDVISLSRISLTSLTVLNIVKLRNYTAKNQDGKEYPLNTTNLILDGNFVLGIKTGYTDGAGQCLLAYAEKDGHKIISVVLNSPGRFPESLAHLNFVFKNFIW